MGDLAGQWSKQLPLRQGFVLRKFTGSQAPDPLDGLRERPQEVPLDDEEGDQRDQQDVEEEAHKVLTPQPVALYVDVAGVVNEQERSANPTYTMERQDLQVPSLLTHDKERVSPLVRLYRLTSYLRQFLKASRKAGRDGKRLAVARIHDDPRQAFAVSKPLDEAS